MCSPFGERNQRTVCRSSKASFLVRYLFPDRSHVGLNLRPARRVGQPVYPGTRWAMPWGAGSCCWSASTQLRMRWRSASNSSLNRAECAACRQQASRIIMSSWSHESRVSTRRTWAAAFTSSSGCGHSRTRKAGSCRVAAASLSSSDGPEGGQAFRQLRLLSEQRIGRGGPTHGRARVSPRGTNWLSWWRIPWRGMARPCRG
jgi:hypothetical protein